MNYLPTLHALLLNDALRMEALIALRRLHLPDGWIGAGFVRDAVWAYQHKYPRSPVPADVDVVWFNDSQCSEAQDREREATLKRLSPAFNWSVKNQARMHRRNGGHFLSLNGRCATFLARDRNGSSRKAHG